MNPRRSGEGRDPYAGNSRLNDVASRAQHERPGLWVPAFAGTTMEPHLNARFSQHSSRCGENLAVNCYHRPRRRTHGTSPLSETHLWICRGRDRACCDSERGTAGAAIIAGSGKFGCPSGRHQRRRGRPPQAGTCALGPPSASALAPPPLGLAPPLASPSLGMASPPSLAPSPLVRPSRSKKNPARAGFLHSSVTSVSQSGRQRP
jgi:hypothetical protein